ncbi:MAG TPA: hydroxymyristoyl-ACP dehydratase, partial [Leclercia adecarboxylata]|nr:hydroxymyristoyl-ACP dehydratase [Leclercia adecarboxylata]
MKIHEIERHQAQPQQLEIVLHLNPALFWFQAHFA